MNNDELKEVPDERLVELLLAVHTLKELHYKNGEGAYYRHYSEQMNEYKDEILRRLSGRVK